LLQVINTATIYQIKTSSISAKFFTTNIGRSPYFNAMSGAGDIAGNKETTNHQRWALLFLFIKRKTKIDNTIPIIGE
jgi:hypothetical protein